MKNKVAISLLAALGLMSGNAIAELQFNGFASIKAGISLDDDKSLFGYDDSVSFKPESLFALQTTATLGEGLTATAQVMARGKDDFDAKFEWAYISYALGDNGQINAGRLRIPFYRYSDFLDVGYAYNWLRPPSTVYNLPFSNFDGISYTHNHTLGNWDSTVQVSFGSFDGGINLISDSDPSELESLAGINWTLGNDWITARAVYMVAETTISFENDPTGNLTSGLELFGTLFPEQGARLEVREDDSSFFGFGISIDKNNFLVDVEMTNVEVEDSLVAEQEQYYVSLGYRFDELTVYTTIEHQEYSHDYSLVSTLPVTIDLPNGNGGVSQIPLQATYAGILASQEREDDVFSVGAKYNFHPSAALKVDYSTRDRKDGDEISVLSVGVDLVF